MKVSTLYPSQCTLGESPVWHHRRGSYFWVDIEQGVLHELNMTSNNVEIWNLNRRVSFIVEQKDDTLILGMQGGLMIFNPLNNSLIPLIDVDKEHPENRCNDGACDGHGRVWFGTMDIHVKEKAGSLYCVDAQLNVRKVLGELTIPNGIVWAHDNTHMYFIETPSRAVRSYFFDKQTDAILSDKVVIIIPEEMGLPDGMTIDNEGMLWIALYGGSAISRWNPGTGKLLAKIELPAPHITNCCFGGDTMADLVVTSARENLSAEQLERYPHSGDVFIIKGAGFKGVENYKANFRS